MLVLERKVGEEIEIGPDIRIVVLEVRTRYHGHRCGARVKLGFLAPDAVSISRTEVPLARRIRKPRKP